MPSIDGVNRLQELKAGISVAIGRRLGASIGSSMIAVIEAKSRREFEAGEVDLGGMVGDRTLDVKFG